MFTSTLKSLKLTAQTKELAQELSEDEIRQFDYDKLILSQGSQAVRPPIDGEAQSHVVTLWTPEDLQEVRGLMLNRDICNVCIIGGGFIGLEAAENLQKVNFEVSIFEQLPHALPPADADIAEILHAELKRHGADLFLHDGVGRIERSHVVLASNGRDPGRVGYSRGRGEG
ncbi:hypothetical protein J3459_010550 [Metarhizium acridum]|uniref:uncharacterized protein n=1 Tax=Metarhizium acridum TaxID=92637 RepID=UPI001C6CCCA1|nr:hypothetical protein J3458_020788 [Metarhizium acridum]KAG8422256.1 hypothetical protein J3459_010550 [Metarhizium acridum]